MIRRHVTALRIGLMSVDVLSAVLLFSVISLIRFGPTWPAAWRSAGVDPIVALAAWGAVWVTVLWVLGLYRLRTRWSGRSEFADLVRATVFVALATFTALFVAKLPDVSRFFLIVLFGSQFVVTLVSRLAIRTLLRRLRSGDRILRYMLVVGTGDTARKFADRVERHRELGLRVIGHLSADRLEHPSSVASLAAELGDRPVLGTLDSIEEVLHGTVVDEVAICLPPESIAIGVPITRICEEVGQIVRITLGYYNGIQPGGRVEDFDGLKILSLVYGPDRVVGLLLKRLIDLALGAIALVLLSPLFALLAIAIAILDGRPVFFRQTRVGLHGRQFKVVKFRTMVPDAEERLEELEALNEIQGPAFKLTVDPRLSRTGRFLRATSLDELPQLLNVIAGQMSLVGPRPPLPREVADYDLWHRRRLSMKPGITGLWQVEARRDSDFNRWVELDLAYIDRWSIWLDLKIMIRTIPAMLQGR
jgi:exopolysaccharide biosynthesis polyprenyl glycosylphosphotransferase